MEICYEIVGTCCSLCHRRSVYFWRDSSVSKGSSDIHSRPHHQPPRRFILRRCHRRPRRLRACQQQRSDLTMAAPVTLVATTDSRAEHPALTRTVSASTSWEHRRRRRSRRREPHRRRSRSHHRRLLERPGDAGPAGRRHDYTPKYPPAVKAMPACRPSGLPYER